jgi:hypothetical protein
MRRVVGIHSKDVFTTQRHVITSSLDNLLDWILTGIQKSDIGQPKDLSSLPPVFAEVIVMEKETVIPLFKRYLSERYRHFPPRNNRRCRVNVIGFYDKPSYLNASLTKLSILEKYSPSLKSRPYLM